ncbi:hypothetical protein FB451DRAFT_1172666 [Mycena latifolia]|nr:hypothetical protein FB451DRAFT_1172666 [Mycena latifolia]
MVPTLYGTAAKLCTADGPWLYFSATLPHFDSQSAALKLSSVSANARHPSIKSAVPTDSLTLPPAFHPRDGRDLSKEYVGPAMFPLIVFDMLLHTFDPEFPAPTNMSRHAFWHQLLQDTKRDCVAYLAHLEKTNAAPPRAPSAQPHDPKSRHLDLLSGKGKRPGSRALWNIRQAAFIIRLYLSGDFSLSNESVARLAIGDAARDGIILTADEVSSHLPIPEITTPLFLALAHSPIVLLREDVSYTTKGCADPLAYFERWRSAGNEHRATPGHPLGDIDRLLWRLIFQAAVHACTPHDVLVRFFEDAAVQNALSRPCDPMHANALAYAADTVRAETTPPLTGPNAAALRTRVAAVETELAAAQRENLELQNAAATHRIPPPIADLHVVALESRVAALEAELAAAQRENLELQNAVTARSAVPPILDPNVGALEGRVAVLEHNLAGAQQENLDLQSMAHARSIDLHAARERETRSLQRETESFERETRARHAAEDALRAERLRFTELRDALGGALEHARDSLACERQARQLTDDAFRAERQRLAEREKALGEREARLDDRAARIDAARDTLAAHLARTMDDIRAPAEEQSAVDPALEHGRPPKRKRVESSTGPSGVSPRPYNAVDSRLFTDDQIVLLAPT